MFATKVMAMQPTRMLLMRRTAPVLLRQSPQMLFRPSMRAREPVPKDEHQAHTVSQRLRSLKKIPAELIPLGIVLAVAVVFAFVSLFRKLWVDKTLRLRRQAGNN
ncbi:hypothetical protein P154DRAFT_616522 [Amniculicola lignicola CBS 123094]|uniref:Uncharacterized protein n=1 Tax=Amniculicola lignicola CBS 123094 TaxID=1392246 RepID=A0A6A5WYP6_9PLEO|nr:hypothetical protein P154DRAFT_616522 [Amniculicola lignicola CBS 123094]